MNAIDESSFDYAYLYEKPIEIVSDFVDLCSRVYSAIYEYIIEPCLTYLSMVGNWVFEIVIAESFSRDIVKDLIKDFVKGSIRSAFRSVFF